MQICSLPYPSAALVIEWHIIGMFAPAFFAGWLVQRFGALPDHDRGCAHSSSLHRPP